MKRIRHIFRRDDACVVCTRAIRHIFRTDDACVVSTWVIALIMLLALTACDSDVDTDDQVAAPPLTITEVRHSDDWKHLDLYARVTNLENLNIDFERDSLLIEEFNRNGDPVNNSLVARFSSYDNIGSRIIDSLGINVSVLVDLTLPQNLVDSQRMAVSKMSYIYNCDNLYITFLHADSISSTYMFTDYIRDNFFISESDTLAHKHLYRAIYRLMSDKHLFQGDAARHVSTSYSALIVFSDGNVYGMDETPIDPDHYQLQSDILALASRDTAASPFFYLNLDNSQQGATNDAENFLRLLADRTNGGYCDKFEWSAIATSMFDYFKMDYNDFILHFEYPSDRLFDGKNMFKAYMVGADTTYLLFETSFMVGNVCKPVIIDGEPQTQVILQGIIIAITLIILIYLVCQFIIPYIQYRLFRRRHVTTYAGPNTTLSGITVGDTCYYCKAPFRKGESVVAKCEHTMHESCWRENDYHCPEYGRKCRHGSHYYNEQDLFDPRNAWFYMTWLISSVVIALFAWMGFIIFDQEITYKLLIGIYARIKEIPLGTPEYDEIVLMFADTLDQLPSFGAFLGFVFTLVLGWLASDIHEPLTRIYNVLLRSVMSGICGYIFFLLGLVLAVVMNLGENTFWIDWMPWTATAFVSVFAASYRTRLHPRGKWFFGMIVVGIISMFAWNIIFSVNNSDYRLLIYVSCLIYALGVSLSIAQPLPHSGNYVLHVSGNVKEMDIALYKWFKRSAVSRVTIGRSIDCSIQTSWDIQGNVAAVHAEIVLHNGQLCLVPLEDGIYNRNRMLPVGKRFILYHGRTFTIGTTTFTFHERDLH